MAKQERIEQAAVCREIGARTGGDILIGVVGPVRTGKSTLIKQFMEKLVLPAIGPEDAKLRARDELPQSAAGRRVQGAAHRLCGLHGGAGDGPRGE